uniref:hypothetical protein n=1 Tax=Gelidibacter sp. TaxID=2018083 RepID=UPI00404A6DA7
MKLTSNFFTNTKDYPILTGFICGLYPLLFYYSNNYFAINSLEHLGFFSLVFIGLPIVIFTVSYYIFGLNSKFIKYRNHLLFVLIIVVTAALLSQAMFLT